jgi:hypothetical protein
VPIDGIAASSRSCARLSRRRSITVSNQTDGNGPGDALRPRVVMMETPRRP